MDFMLAKVDYNETYKNGLVKWALVADQVLSIMCAAHGYVV